MAALKDSLALSNRSGGCWGCIWGCSPRHLCSILHGPSHRSSATFRGIVWPSMQGFLCKHLSEKSWQKVWRTLRYTTLRLPATLLGGGRDNCISIVPLHVTSSKNLDVTSWYQGSILGFAPNSMVVLGEFQSITPEECLCVLVLSWEGHPFSAWAPTNSPHHQWVSLQWKQETQQEDLLLNSRKPALPPILSYLEGRELAGATVCCLKSHLQVRQWSLWCFTGSHLSHYKIGTQWQLTGPI